MVRRDLHALRQYVAEALPVGYHLEQSVGGLGVAPLGLQSAKLLLGQVPLLEALHHPADYPAELVDVHAGLIDLGV